MDGGSGKDTHDGGKGENLIAFQSGTSVVVVDLAITGPQNTRGSGTDTITGFQGIDGTDFDDDLRGAPMTFAYDALDLVARGTGGDAPPQVGLTTRTVAPSDSTDGATVQSWFF